MCAANQADIEGRFALLWMPAAWCSSGQLFSTQVGCFLTFYYLKNKPLEAIIVYYANSLDIFIIHVYKTIKLCCAPERNRIY